MKNKEYLQQIILRIIAIVSSIYGTIISSSTLKTFTYFTILSNIFLTIVLLIFLVKSIKGYMGKSAKISNTLYIVKFLATISITLTMLVFMFLLAPTFETGFIGSYTMNHCGSLCVHFIAPLLAIIDFFLFDYEFKSDKKSAVFAIIPPLTYAAFIIIAGQLGMRWGNMMAPYNFLNYGAPTGWFGFDLSLLGSETLGIGVAYMIVILSLIFIGIGELYLLIKDKRRAKMIK